MQEWEAGRQAEKEMVSEEIEKIRKSIQALTSAANPLGKLFDFLQEDVDEMQRELQHWKNVNEKLQKQQQSELEWVLYETAANQITYIVENLIL